MTRKYFLAAEYEDGEELDEMQGTEVRQDQLSVAKPVPKSSGRPTPTPLQGHSGPHEKRSLETFADSQSHQPLKVRAEHSNLYFERRLHLDKIETRGEADGIYLRLLELLEALTDTLKRHGTGETLIGELVSEANLVLQSLGEPKTLPGMLLEAISTLTTVPNAPKVIAILHHAGAPAELVRACLSELRLAHQFDFLAAVAEPITRAELAKPSMFSIAELRSRLNSGTLPLDIDLGLANKRTEAAVIAKYGLDVDAQLLDELRRRSSFVVSSRTIHPREFPWFEGAFSLVERGQGQPEARWDLRIQAGDRVLARHVKFNVEGRVWAGNLFSTNASGDNRAFEGRVELTDALTPSKLSLDLAEGWASGFVDLGDDGRSGVLGRISDETSDEPGTAGAVNDVVLSNGVFFDSCIAPAMGSEYAFAAFVRPSPLAADLKVVLAYRGLVLKVGRGEVVWEDSTDAISSSLVFALPSASPVEWVHLCIMRRGQEKALFLNSAILGGPSQYMPVKSDGAYPRPRTLLIGALNERGSSSFEGSICDVHVFSRALCEEELRGLIAGKPPVSASPNLIARYPLVKGSAKGLGFLENIRDPERPLVIRPKVINLPSQSKCPFKDVLELGFVGRVQVRSLISGFARKDTWLTRSFKGLRSGFHCTVRLRMAEMQPRITRIQLRVQSMCTLQRREFPNAPTCLVAGVQNLPAMALTLTRCDGNRNFVLEAASRLATGSIVHMSKVFSLQSEGLDLGQIELTFTSDGEILRVFANETEQLCEVSINLEDSPSPYFVGLMTEPNATLDVFEFQSMAVNDKQERPGAPPRLKICLQCNQPHPDETDLCTNCVYSSLNVSAEAVLDTWTCTHCTVMNEAHVNVCHVCSEPRVLRIGAASSVWGGARVAQTSATRPVPPPPPPMATASSAVADVSCPSCTFLNPLGAPVCTMCGSVLPAPPPAQYAQPAMSSAFKATPTTTISQPTAHAARPVPSRQDASLLHDNGWQHLKTGLLASTSSQERGAKSVELDSTRGLCTMTISPEFRVMYRCEGQLEGAKVQCYVTFDADRDHWRVEGTREDGLTFMLVLNTWGEQMVSGTFRDAHRSGAWYSGEYQPLVESLRGMAPGSCFKVGLQNMVPGLVNICSQNSLLQALFACQALKDAVMEAEPMDETTRALKKLFVNMETTPFRRLGARELQRTLPAKYRQAQEMDATEFASDVFSSLEEGLGAQSMHQLMSVQRETRLRCLKCSNEKALPTEVSAMTILPLPKHFTPVLNMYLYVCEGEHELPPVSLDTKLGIATNTVRLPLSLSGDNRASKVYLYLERAADSSVTRQHGCRPITEVEIGRDSKGDGERIPVYTSRGRTDLVLSDVFVSQIFVRRSTHASPITDVQVLRADASRILPGYRQTPVVTLNAPARDAVSLAFACTMPVSDVFVGTRADAEAKRLEGYACSETAIGEDPESGQEVFLWYSTAETGLPPVTKLNIIKRQEAAMHIEQQEDDSSGESICGYIPIGFRSSFALLQTRNGVGSPITKLDVVTLMNATNPALPRFDDSIDVAAALQERIEDVYVLTSRGQTANTHFARDFPSVGSRFVRQLDAPLTIHRVTGRFAQDRIRDSFDGVVHVWECADGRKDVHLLARFQSNAGDFLHASWSDSMQRWSTAEGSSLILPDAGVSVPRVYALQLIDPANQPMDTGSWVTVRRVAGHQVRARISPLSPDELPLSSLIVVSNPSDEAVIAPPAGCTLVFTISEEAGGSLVHNFFVTRASDTSAAFVSQIEFLDTDKITAMGGTSSVLAGKEIVGEIGDMTVVVSLREPRWHGRFQGENVDFEVERTNARVLKGQRTYLDFPRKPLSYKIDGILFSEDASSDVARFIGVGWGESAAGRRYLLVEADFSSSTGQFRMSTPFMSLNGVRDDVLRIGVQRDSSEYWEEGKCMFTSRKSGNDLQSMLSLAGNSEILDHQDNLVVCESERCTGSKQPHLSLKSFGKDLPSLLVLHVDRLKFDELAQRTVKDLRKTPLQVILEVNSHRFALFAIIVHVGPNAQSGHYFTFARDVQQASLAHLDEEDALAAPWVEFNDASTRPVRFEAIRNLLERGHGTETPYILCYWRLDRPVPTRSVTLSEAIVEVRAANDAKLLGGETATRPFLEARRVYCEGSSSASVI